MSGVGENRLLEDLGAGMLDNIGDSRDTIMVLGELASCCRSDLGAAASCVV